jgi:hypothetical protein
MAGCVLKKISGPSVVDLTNPSSNSCWKDKFVSSVIGITKRNGDIWWMENALLHRDGAPAVVCCDGSKFWYCHGEKHRKGGPAFVDANGNSMWYLNGKLHREDGPAIEFPGGMMEWYLNGERHREDGPAVESFCGMKAYMTHENSDQEDTLVLSKVYKHTEWWFNGKQYLENKSGVKEWWINGTVVSLDEEEEFSGEEDEYYDKYDVWMNSENDDEDEENYGEEDYDEEDDY